MSLPTQIGPALLALLIAANRCTTAMAADESTGKDLAGNTVERNANGSFTYDMEPGEYFFRIGAAKGAAPSNAIAVNTQQVLVPAAAQLYIAIGCTHAAERA